jgi:hypothetical protein
MSLIVAARFDTFDAAENAARALFRAGFEENAVSIFFVNQAGAHARHPIGGDQTNDPGARNSPTGAVMGATMMGLLGLVFGGLAWFAFRAPVFAVIVATCIGAYIGSLAGGLLATRQHPRVQRPGQNTEAQRHAGVLAAVHVTAETEALAARTLRDMGGKEVEQAVGRWRDGKWVDFDPVQPPVLSDKVPTTPG